MTRERLGLVFLVVMVLTFGRGQGLQIISYPEENAAAEYYSTVFMYCMAIASDDSDNGSVPTITWSLNEQTVDNLSKDITVTPSNVSTESVITGENMTIFWSMIEICNINYTIAEGGISCNAANSEEEVSKESSISLGAPQKVIELVYVPQNPSVNYGSNVEMVCMARGEPYSPITITFSLNGNLLDTTTSDILTVYTDYITDGSKTLTRTTLYIQEIDVVGEFSCSATNNQASDTKSWEVTFLDDPIASELVMVPNDLTVNYRSMVSMNCSAYGSPLPAIVITKDQTELDYQSSNLQLEQTVLNINGRTARQLSLTILVTDGDNSGEYTCTSFNRIGNDSQSWSLYVAKVPSPAKLLVKPKSPVHINKSRSVAIMCIGVGYPLPTVTFINNGRPTDALNVSSNTVTIVGGRENATQATLVICDLDESDLGSYSCVASNVYGNQSHSWNLSDKLVDTGSNPALYATGGILSLLLVLGILFVIVLAFVIARRWKRNSKKRDRKDQLLWKRKKPNCKSQQLPFTPIEENLKNITQFDDETNKLDPVEEIYEELDFETRYDNDNPPSKKKRESLDKVYTLKNEAYVETGALSKSVYKNTDNESYLNMDMDCSHSGPSSKNSLRKPMTTSNTASMLSDVTYSESSTSCLVELTPRALVHASTFPTKLEDAYDYCDYTITPVMAKENGKHPTARECGNGKHGVECHTVNEEGTIYDNDFSDSVTDAKPMFVNKTTQFQEEQQREGMSSRVSATTSSKVEGEVDVYDNVTEVLVNMAAVSHHGERDATKDEVLTREDTIYNTKVEHAVVEDALNPIKSHSNVAHNESNGDLVTNVSSIQTTTTVQCVDRKVKSLGESVYSSEEDEYM